MTWGMRIIKRHACKFVQLCKQKEHIVSFLMFVKLCVLLSISSFTFILSSWKIARWMLNINQSINLLFCFTLCLYCSIVRVLYSDRPFVGQYLLTLVICFCDATFFWNKVSVVKKKSTKLKIVIMIALLWFYKIMNMWIKC